MIFEKTPHSISLCCPACSETITVASEGLPMDYEDSCDFAASHMDCRLPDIIDKDYSHTIELLNALKEDELTNPLTRKGHGGL